MLNMVVLIGRLGKDPDLRYTGNNHAVTTFSIAVDRAFGDKETDWIDIVAWREQAEFACNYLGKGRLIAVYGRLQIRGWTDRDGIKRKNAEVVVDRIVALDKPSQTTNNATPPAQAPVAISPEMAQQMMAMLAAHGTPMPQLMQGVVPDEAHMPDGPVMVGVDTGADPFAET